MKIALVHDYLVQDGGAEKVLDVFHEMWPDAPIFVLFYDKQGIPRYANADVRESFIAQLPLGRKKYQWYLPIMPRATELYDLSEFDVIISSVSAFAKGVNKRADAVHISYCHTPTRYLWSDSDSYIRDLKYPFFVKACIHPLINKLRIWDKESTHRVNFFIANSKTVQDRISFYYERESDIIHPPIDVRNFYVSPTVGDYFLAGGRIAAYKRFDLIIDVFNRLQYPLKIFGTGPSWWKDIQKKAKGNIEFLGRVSDEEKYDLYSNAKAYIHPQVEDFGITPIESMASGRPVIAFAKGGATETVIPGKTGVLFSEQTWESLLDAVINFDAHNWNSEDIRAWAVQFDAVRFKKAMQAYVAEKVNQR
jgi:glycosyltransferase involved in cell wall biosynthesis